MSPNASGCCAARQLSVPPLTLATSVKPITGSSARQKNPHPNDSGRPHVPRDRHSTHVAVTVANSGFANVVHGVTGLLPRL